MRNDEYEMAYREARAVLHRRGKTLEAPYSGSDGHRYCNVDGHSFSDWEIFREAWDEGLANELFSELHLTRALRRAV
jgi:hypothetical protein